MAFRLLDINGKPVGVNLTLRGNIVYENTLENSVHGGRRYFVRNFQTMATDEVVNFLVVPVEGYDIHFEAELTSDILCEVETLYDVTVSDYGDELTPLNQNQNYRSISPNVGFYQGVTYSGGTSSMKSKIDANRKTTASRYDTGEFVLAYPYNTLVKITASDNGYVTWNFGFSEIVANSY